MHAIELSNLGRKYGDRWAVRGLTFEVEQGEVFGLLGPNGAGKTTTMRMLACLIAPSEGRAAVCGYDIVAQPTEVRRRVGILTEAPGLYGNRTAQQNLEFYAELYGLSPTEAREQSGRYLKLLDLWERRGDKADTFSKGMKQKLSLARALLHEPPVVILDEPTSALDPEGARLVRDSISSLKSQGRTIILCTHNLFEAQSLCDRVAIIKGTMLHMDTPARLQRSLYKHQVEVRLKLPAGDGLATAAQMAEMARALPGVDEVIVRENSLLVSTNTPDDVTPGLVQTLSGKGARILRVAEVEHTLEKAYLDLISRHSSTGNGAGDTGAEEPEVEAGMEEDAEVLA